MAYFADLTPYTYLKREPDQRLLNVGWLDNEHDYPAGEIEPALLDKLFDLCLKPARQTRGWYHCLFCPPQRGGYKTEWHARQIILGSAEIRVRGREGVEFASPNLIFHYVRDHKYLPPREFLDALRDA